MAAAPAPQHAESFPRSPSPLFSPHARTTPTFSPSAHHPTPSPMPPCHLCTLHTIPPRDSSHIPEHSSITTKQYSLQSCSKCPRLPLYSITDLMHASYTFPRWCGGIPLLTSRLAISFHLLPQLWPLLLSLNLPHTPTHPRDSKTASPHQQHHAPHQWPPQHCPEHRPGTGKETLPLRSGSPDPNTSYDTITHMLYTELS